VADLVASRKGLSECLRRRMRKIKMLLFIQKIAGEPREGAPLERLEPCEGKLSRTVLRGVWAG
jgi:hypothetical protein